MNVGEFYNPWKLFTGIFIPESLVSLSHKVLSPGAKILFGRLAFHAGKRGECWPSHVTLADEIGVSERSVRDYLKELEDGKFVQRFRDGNSHLYKFVWNESLDDSIRPEMKHRQNPAGAENTGSGTGRILPPAPAESCQHYKEEKNHGKEVKEEPPLPPKGETTEPLYEPSPIADPDTDCEVTLDTICGYTQERYELLAGRGTSAPSGKWAEPLFAAYQDLGSKRFDDRIALFAGGRSRSLDDFARSFRRPSHPIPHQKASGAPQSNGRSGGVRQYPRQAAAPIRHECAPPAEALRWNQEIPGHAWGVWDEQLDEKWRLNTVAMNGRFEKWLSRCAEYSKAAKKQGKYGAGFSLAKALDNWPDVFNGRFEWMTAPDRAEKADAPPERRYREL